ncbi:MAG: YebC/PmpR family DNA-binding transcriptional regulator [Saprospiraceae bacterium]|nr:YebC/PmpR family DNA-binding transcriptional regulator [Saprospiraceae bacterium]
MGRAFEYRKERKFKRWAAMAKSFTKVGREIAIAVKEGGTNPEANSRLRLAMQNARACNMPKANVEAAIKRASSKEAENYSEIVYEGYAPHGIAVLVETTTDNPTRTVANIRHIFSKFGGSLGTSGSVDYLFFRKGKFVIKAENIQPEELEFELIDFGLDELKVEGDEIILYTTYEDFGTMQVALENKNIEALNSELVRIPTIYKTLNDDEVEDVIRLIEKMEEDEDVVNVFHTMDESE